MAGQIKTRPFRLTSQQPTESSEGAALIRWRDVAKRQYPELTSLYRIPNGGDMVMRASLYRAKNSEAMEMRMAQQMKREGTLKGIPDYCLPVARGGFHAFYFELKRRDGGRISDDQKAIHSLLREQGNRVEIACGWEEAKAILLEYLALPMTSTRIASS